MDHKNYEPIKLFLTGATGVMGKAGLNELTANPGEYEITVLARDSKINRKKLRPYIDKGVKVIWGDLINAEDVAKGCKDAEIVLHVGGMVSPKADWHPEKTIDVNTIAMKNIITGIKEAKKGNPDREEAKLVYIGSVAQYGNRAIPDHWGGIGDSLIPAKFDAYAYSKIEAERLLVESGLKRWVSLRQTGILHPGLLMNASDPISFHVPVRGVLEWVTADDSGRLLERVSRRDVLDGFWCDFYNIGGGESFRMTNYEFESKLLKALGCPTPEKVFDARWFATQNFHGMWYHDSDRLENFLHFRSGENADEYFNRMVKTLPPYFKLTPLAPSFIIKAVMKRVAHTPELGPMWWIKNNVTSRINAAFGSKEEWTTGDDWSSIDLTVPSKKLPDQSGKKHHTPLTSHLLRRERTRNAKGNEFRIDNLVLQEDYSESGPDDYFRPLRWKCDNGHEFTASMMLVERGGHRCSQCIRQTAVFHKEA